MIQRRGVAKRVFRSENRVCVFSFRAQGAREASCAVRQTVAARDIELSVYRVATPDEIGPAIEAAQNAEAKALNGLASPMLFQNRNVIFSALARARMPAIYQWSEMAMLYLEPEKCGTIVEDDNVRVAFPRTAKLSALARHLEQTTPSEISFLSP
jgi:hypothetical protein